MGKLWGGRAALVAVLLTVACWLGLQGPAGAQMPDVQNAKLIDVPNDDGSGLGIVYALGNHPGENGGLAVEMLYEAWMADKFKLSEAEQARLDKERDAIREDLAVLLKQRDELAAQVDTASGELTLAQNTINETKDVAGLKAKREAFWKLQNQLSAVEQKIARRKDVFVSRVGPLQEKDIKYQHLASMVSAGWSKVATIDTTAPSTKKDFPQRFGAHPKDPDTLYYEFNSVKIPLPQDLQTQQADGYNYAGDTLPAETSFPLWPGHAYNIRLVSTENAFGKYTTFEPLMIHADLLNSSLMNNIVMTILLAILVLSAIQIARRNPNLFIRRIAGLEAVDEAIGRATEMGKPVLYINGMNPLEDIATISSINILGRVSRRIADFDSDLLVPTRDPVVFTVAQEVVKQGYADAGRPDAFRADNIFFVTDDQFSYTASVCGIMLREKPAANFMMGYYFAESLLLAETGASTGAIQIAGTDSPNQLPFFITTCDYTLIGEELYAASAYLSRDPLLLGSLKGLDAAKALMMLCLLLQAVLFIAAAIGHGDPEKFSFIKNMFEAVGG